MTEAVPFVHPPTMYGTTHLKAEPPAFVSNRPRPKSHKVQFRAIHDSYHQPERVFSKEANISDIVEITKELESMSEALNQRDQERYLKLQTEKEQHFSGAEYTLSGDQLALDFARLTIEVEDLLYDDASNFLSSSKSQFRSSYSTLKRSQSASHRKKQTTISAKARKLFGPSRSFIMAQEFPEHKQPSYLKNPHLSLVDRKIELLRQEIRDKLANRPTQRSQSAPSRRKELERRRKLEEPFEKQFLEDNIWLSAKTTQELCSERPSAIMEQLVLTKEKNEKARISQVFKLNQLREQAKADKLELSSNRFPSSAILTLQPPPTDRSSSRPSSARVSTIHRIVPSPPRTPSPATHRSQTPAKSQQTPTKTQTHPSRPRPHSARPASDSVKQTPLQRPASFVAPKRSPSPQHPPTIPPFSRSSSAHQITHRQSSRPTSSKPPSSNAQSNQQPSHKVISSRPVSTRTSTTSRHPPPTRSQSARTRASNTSALSLRIASVHNSTFLAREHEKMERLRAGDAMVERSASPGRTHVTRFTAKERQKCLRWSVIIHVLSRASLLWFELMRNRYDRGDFVQLPEHLLSPDIADCDDNDIDS